MATVTIPWGQGGGNVEVMRTVRQEGRREYLRDASGDLLRDSNDVELKALK